MNQYELDEMVEGLLKAWKPVQEAQRDLTTTGINTPHFDPFTLMGRLMLYLRRLDETYSYLRDLREEWPQEWKNRDSIESEVSLEGKVSFECTECGTWCSLDIEAGRISVSHPGYGSEFRVTLPEGTYDEFGMSKYVHDRLDTWGIGIA